MDKGVPVSCAVPEPRAIAQVALIMPVKNEAHALADFFDAYGDFTVLPSEIVFVDAGSSDGTQAILQAWCRRQEVAGIAACVMAAPGAGPGGGRNAGVDGSSAPLVAFIDAGIRPEPDWLERLVETIESTRCHAVQGVCRFDAEGPLGLAVCALTYGVGRIRPVLPASIFSRLVFQRAGRFDATARAGEDIRWLAAVREACGELVLCNGARVHYRRFPVSLSAVYAKWRMYEESVTGTPVGRRKRMWLVATCMGCMIGLVSGGPILGGLVAGYLLIRVVIDPVRRSRDALWWRRSPLALLMVPIVALVIDGGSLAGMLKGWFRPSGRGG